MRRRFRLAAAVLATSLALSACASLGPRAPRWNFFAAPGGSEDAWHRKVEEWQRRARAEAGVELLPASLGRKSESAATLSGRLEVKMATWEREEKRALAKRITVWTQQEARRHYRHDPSGEPLYDHWPTVGELLARNGDDCDGLDLIAYQLLREFGFDEEQVYRLVVRRDRDGANHMVTVWFEEPGDPWVLDGTGAMTLSMRRFSEIRGWTPTKMFNERHQYRVHPLEGSPTTLAWE